MMMRVFFFLSDVLCQVVLFRVLSFLQFFVFCLFVCFLLFFCFLFVCLLSSLFLCFFVCCFVAHEKNRTLCLIFLIFDKDKFFVHTSLNC